jgi:RNA polymerase sigma-70 factor (sigma-E family)
MPEPSKSKDQHFSEYFNDAWDRLRLRAFYICRDWEQAADLVQHALMVAYKHWDKIEDVANPDAYITKIMVRSHLRERRSRSSDEILMAELPEPQPTTALEAEAVDERIALIAALRQLGRRQRTVVALRYLADLQVDVAAQILTCAPSTVRSQSARALTTLRDILE